MLHLNHPAPGPSSPPPAPGPKHSLFSTYARIAVALAALTWDVATDIRTAHRERKAFAGRRTA